MRDPVAADVHQPQAARPPLQRSAPYPAQLERVGALVRGAEQVGADGGGGDKGGGGEGIGGKAGGGCGGPITVGGSTIAMPSSEIPRLEARVAVRFERVVTD